MKRFLVIGCLIATCHTYADDDIQNAIDELSNKAHNTGMYIEKNEDGEVVLTNDDEISDVISHLNARAELRQKRLEEYANHLYQQEEDARVALAKKPDARIGMTSKQVRNNTNWGEPLSIRTTITKYGKQEQWIYEGYQYLYFENGVLTTIQQ